MKNWIFNEKEHCGIDYSDIEIIKKYDVAHQKFRNYKEEANHIVKLLNLMPNDTIIDIGCGTGAFAINAASRCKKVIAVDVSEGMLNLLREKAKEKKINNIETICAGFLSYDHRGKKADAVVSVVALHHLPDFWKLIALRKINTALKNGGKFYLFDVVFSFPIKDYEKYFDAWIAEMQKRVKQISEEAIVHIRDEFSTTKTHMELFLKEAGFSIVKKNMISPCTTEYLCAKV
ncbi:MAG: class I SAM-dependent methyltransferase [Candidatus Omnitrophica bacterium]|jgi:ubiquinone/menaquinone biosynthesis C-methylase UbiE|nr:class I SAM-dependent methyltransferase [Candidatus Omnitrophota bacterium]